MHVTRSALALLLGASLMIVGCGDDGLAQGGRDMAVADLSAPPDLVPPEDLAPYPDLVASLGVGMPCPNGNECGPGMLCLGSKLDAQLPAEGYCTKACTNDPDCGANAFCGPPIDKVGNLCWARCGANDTCTNPKQICGRRLGGFTDLVNKACLPGSASAKDGSPCKTFGDCNRNQACVANPFDFPGGYCATIGCTVGDSTTCAPGGTPVCLPADNLNFCFAGCMGDGDCRVNEGYKCLQPPGVNTKICLMINPIGQHCKVQADCAGGPPWSCIVDQTLPAGYCSIIGCDAKGDTGCPTNGHCVPVAGTAVCLKSCNVDGDCASGTKCQTLPFASGNQKVCAP